MTNMNTSINMKDPTANTSTDVKQVSPEQLRRERIRNWTLRRSAHKEKNRSSKGILSITHTNHIRFYESCSNDALREMSKEGNFEADMELSRRAKKRAKREGLQEGK
jgi:hypothetical protein